MSSFGKSLASGLVLAQQINYGKKHPKSESCAPKCMEMEKSGKVEYPPAPMICAVITDSGIVGNSDPPNYQPPVYGGKIPPALIPLQMNEVSLQVECFINTAFVTLEGCWKLHCVKSGYSCDCLVTVPMHEQGTITCIEISIGGRLYVTQLVPSQDVSQYVKKAQKDEIGTLNPYLFSLKIPKVKAGEVIALTVTWFQMVPFSGGQFFISIPFTFPKYVLPSNKDLSEITKIRYSIYAGAQKQILVEELSHPMKEISRQLGEVRFSDNAEAGTWKNSDCVCSYKVWSNSIWATLLNCIPKDVDDDRDKAFILFLCPPDPQFVQAFRRAVIFLIDRSGSMHGKAMEDTKAAVLFSLSKLTSLDYFNIIVFDHEALLFSSCIQEATSDMIENAKDWISKNCQATGGTNILGPLNKAMDILSKVKGAIPYIFLITDGSVEDEQSICHAMQASIANMGPTHPRICTFGIGLYCNHYFLKMLSLIGKGIYSVAFTDGTIKTQLERMLSASSAPLLTNVCLDIADHPEQYEVYPLPIPDLHSGRPLVLSGRFHGKPPKSVKLVGSMLHTDTFVLEVQAQKSEQIPLNQIFAKQQLDLLTTQAWLSGNKQLEEQAIKISLSAGIPCEFTQMVAFETSKEKYGMLSKQSHKVQRIELSNHVSSKHTNIALVGVLALGFGNISATISNKPIRIEEDGPSPIIGEDKVYCCDKCVDKCCNLNILSVCSSCCCFCCCCCDDEDKARLSDRCVNVWTQACTSVFCFGCIELCNLCCCQ